MHTEVNRIYLTVLHDKHSLGAYHGGNREPQASTICGVALDGSVMLKMSK